VPEKRMISVLDLVIQKLEEQGKIIVILDSNIRNIQMDLAKVKGIGIVLALLIPILTAILSYLLRR